jgi:hypothetical protein
MNRTVFAATAALLAIAVPTAATATAATKRKPAPKPVKKVRTITLTYSNPCGVTLNSSAAYGPGASNCTTPYQISTTKTEKYMSVTINDKSGQAVPVTFVEDASSGQVAWEIICGKGTNLAVSPNDTYDLNPVVAVGNTCPVPPTQGTIVVKLSNLP